MIRFYFSFNDSELKEKCVHKYKTKAKIILSKMAWSNAGLEQQCSSLLAPKYSSVYRSTITRLGSVIFLKVCIANKKEAEWEFSCPSAQTHLLQCIHIESQDFICLCRWTDSQLNLRVASVHLVLKIQVCMDLCVLFFFLWLCFWGVSLHCGSFVVISLTVAAAFLLLMGTMFWRMTCALKKSFVLL